jgi:thymidylate synthase
LGTKKHRYVSFPFNIASYATLAKILEEITLFVALGVEGNLKCVHFYDNQFEEMIEMMHEDTEVSQEFKDLCQLFRENQITLDVLFNLMSIDMFKLSGYTSDKAISVEMLAPIKYKKCQVLKTSCYLS